MDDDLRARYRINRPAHPGFTRRSDNRPVAPTVTSKPPVPAPPSRLGLKPPSAQRHHLLEDNDLPAPAIPQRHTKPKKSRSKSFSILVIILVLMAGGAFLYHQRQSKSPVSAAPVIPLPAGLSSRVNYPIYYPSPTPAGYTYYQGSAAVQNGLVFFKLSNGNRYVSFTEQQSPAQPVNLSALPNYQQFIIPAGTAALGTSIGKPAGLVLSRTTLINIATAGGVSSDELKQILSSLAPIAKD